MLCETGAYLITRRPILDSSKLKDFADDNLKFEENGRKLFKLVENTVGKGEIARYEQFLLFPQCFQKDCFQGTSKGIIVWEGPGKCIYEKFRLTWTENFRCLEVFYMYSIICIQKPFKGSNKSGLLQQMVFKCSLCQVD